MALDIPEPPAGFIHVGPVSDFSSLMSTTMAKPEESNAFADSTEAFTLTSPVTTGQLVGCPAPVGSVSIKQTENATVITATKPTLPPSASVVNCAPHSIADNPIKVIEVPQPQGRYPPNKRVAVTHFHGKWYAFLNICPHQGSALSRGSMTDIEDMGIVWGAGVVCSLHGWTFDASSGQSDSTRFVIDTFDIKEIDGHVFVSILPKNSHVQGQRRDFGGKELN